MLGKRQKYTKSNDQELRVNTRSREVYNESSSGPTLEETDKRNQIVACIPNSGDWDRKADLFCIILARPYSETQQADKDHEGIWKGARGHISIYLCNLSGWTSHHAAMENGDKAPSLKFCLNDRNSSESSNPNPPCCYLFYSFGGRVSPCSPDWPPTHCSTDRVSQVQGLQAHITMASLCSIFKHSPRVNF